MPPSLRSSTGEPGVVGVEQIEVAVAVVVERDHAASFAGVGGAGAGGALRERAVAVRQEHARRIGVELDRVGDVARSPAVHVDQVEVAVVVEVGEGRAPAPPADAHAGRRRDVRERAVARVAVEAVAADAPVAR